jgi:hypothetical protein
LKFHANYEEAEALQLKAALLLYGGSKGISFASVHKSLKDQCGAPNLDSGRPVTMEFLRSLAQQLGVDRASRSASCHQISLQNIVLMGCAPRFFLRKYPALVFSLAGHRQLAVRTLLANERPGRNSQIAIAPYWNTSADGRVCLGSMPARKAPVSMLSPSFRSFLDRGLYEDSRG